MIPPKKKLALVRELSKFAVNKISRGKLDAVLYTNNEMPERNCFKNPTRNSIKNSNVGINLTK